jgi:hypothetical protein
MSDPPPYLPPFRLILRGLGIDALDPAEPTTVIDTQFLRFLLAQFARQMTFDPHFYAATYPDVAAAHEAGALADLHTHFAQHGYPEDRLPCLPAFDPDYYLQRNPDLAGLAQDIGVAGLAAHFLRDGWAEARTAHPSAEAPAAQWWQAAHRTPYRLACRTIAPAVVQAFLPPIIATVPFRGGPVLGDGVLDRRLRHRRGHAPVDSCAARATAAADHLAGEYVYAGACIDHFGHALAETLHRILPARALFACRRLLFVDVASGRPPGGCADLPRAMQQPLRYLGVRPRDVTVVHRDCSVACLHVAEQGSTLFGGPVAPYIDMLQAHQTAHLGPQPPPAGRLYVSRSKLRHGGLILGEAYLEKLLAAEGWTVLHPQTARYEAQLRAYRSAEVVLFAEGSAVHGTELLARLGRCLLLPRRNTEAWAIEAALRPRATEFEVLPRGTPLGSVVIEPDTGAPIEGYGINLPDIAAVAWRLRTLGLAELAALDVAAFRRAARRDLAAYLAFHAPDRPAIPTTDRLSPAMMATFEAKARATIG